MPFYAHFPAGLILPLLAFLLAACQPPAEPLRIASSPWPGYEPLYLARDLGYLDERRFRLHELPSSNITLEAFGNGSADVATLTLDETVSLLAQGRQPRILAVMDVSHGADALMVRPDIRALADLKGKRIAIVNIPLGLYMLARTLEAAGLSRDDVSVVTLPEDKHEKAYRQGRIDAAITFEPFKSQLAAAGARPLFDSRQIPDEIFDLMLAREEVYRSRREDLCELVEQWFRTLDYIAARPADAHDRLGRRLGTDARGYAAMLSGLVLPDRAENQRLLSGWQAPAGKAAMPSEPAILAPARRLADIMQREGLIAARVDPALAVDPEFLHCLGE